MNELLAQYSNEEIEALALKQITSDLEDIPLKIEKIDKEYKKHNQKSVFKAIFNGSIIILMTSIILKQDSTLANFGTKDLTAIFNEIQNYVSWLPNSDLILSIYSKLFDGLNLIIEKIGIIGIILATKSFKFILTTFKDTKKSLTMKQELNELKEKLQLQEEQKNVR